LARVPSERASRLARGAVSRSCAACSCSRICSSSSTSSVYSICLVLIVSATPQKPRQSAVREGGALDAGSFEDLQGHHVMGIDAARNKRAYRPTVVEHRARPVHTHSRVPPPRTGRPPRTERPHEHHKLPFQDRRFRGHSLGVGSPVVQLGIVAFGAGSLLSRAQPIGRPTHSQRASNFSFCGGPTNSPVLEIRATRFGNKGNPFWKKGQPNQSTDR
jgi:hypothetical protein